jgi:hypothetical protein
MASWNDDDDDDVVCTNLRAGIRSVWQPACRSGFEACARRVCAPRGEYVQGEQ